MSKFCSCRPCKVMKRKGFVLGTRRMGFWIKSIASEEYEYYFGPVSAYVPHPKFATGRARKTRPVDFLYQAGA